MKTHPVHTVLQGPIMFAFIDRRLFAAAISMAINVAAVSWFSLGLLTFAVIYGIAYWTRDDPMRLVVIGRGLRTRTHYDPLLYESFEVDLQ